MFRVLPRPFNKGTAMPPPCCKLHFEAPRQKADGESSIRMEKKSNLRSLHPQQTAGNPFSFRSAAGKILEKILRCSAGVQHPRDFLFDFSDHGGIFARLPEFPENRICLAGMQDQNESDAKIEGSAHVVGRNPADVLNGLEYSRHIP